MKIAFVLPPSRFPTAVHDPGDWWRVCAGRGHDLRYCNLNTRWWRRICAPDGIAHLFRHCEDEAGRGRALATAASATAALAALKRPRTYADASRYKSAVGAVGSHLDCVGALQGEFTVDFGVGPTLRKADYDDSLSLFEHSLAETLLADSIRPLLAEIAAADIAAFKVTSPQDLLTAMIAARLLRAEAPGIHVCLLDHGYENFSLHACIEALEGTGALALAFDSIIREKDDIPAVMLFLAEALARKERPRGFLGRSDIGIAPTPVEAAASYPQGIDTFCDEPVYWMRLSGRSCYWGRCTYCVQNEKFGTKGAPTKSEISASVANIEALIGSGYRRFIFSDEAVSPAALRLFSEEICRRGLKIRWSCRSKLEMQLSGDLIALVARAGCCEILFGMESTSPATLRRMDKFVEGLDVSRVRAIFRDLDAEGVGVHVNLIAGFPFDTRRELTESVEFLIDSLSTVRNATFTVNTFALFPGTPISRDPARFGIERIAKHGDLQQRIPFRFGAAASAVRAEVDAALPGLRSRLLAELGWEPSNRDAPWLGLYFGTGHGIAFKGAAFNPLDPVQNRARGRAAASA